MKRFFVIILILIPFSIILWRMGLGLWLGGVAASWGVENPPDLSYPEFEYYPAIKRPIIGMALNVHGLNLNPAAMNSITEVYQESGIEVIRPVLLGHRKSTDEARNVTRTVWLQEIQNAARESQRLETEQGLNVPLTCSGFSMGGLLLVDAHLSGIIHCDRMILWAPALTPHVSPMVVRALSLLMPKDFWLPSAIAYPYARFRRASLQPNVALFDSVAAVGAADPTPLRNIPVLILMDPQDELVDYSALQNWISSRGLNWRFDKVTVEGSELPRKVHHQIFDKASLGKKEWDRVRLRLQEFINTP